MNGLPEGDDPLNDALVLIVEDNDVLCTLYRQVFERIGCCVRVAMDGQSALVLLDEEPPQLVVMDVNIPIMSGLEVLNVIRRRPTLMKIKVILLSGNELAGPSGDASAADMYIVKPVRITHLLDVARQLLSE